MGFRLRNLFWRRTGAHSVGMRRVPAPSPAAVAPLPPPPPPLPPPAPAARPKAHVSPTAQLALGEGTRIRVVLEDGTMTAPELDEETEERLRYVVDNIVAPPNDRAT